MSNKTKTGICHLCGVNGKLSYEHVPPRAAFNNRPLVARVRHARQVIFQMAEVAIPRDLFRAMLERIDRLPLPLTG